MTRCFNLSLVSFARMDSVEISNLEQAILDSLNLIDYHFPKNVRNVVIKPNMCYYWDYSTGQTTDPEFIAAIINILRKEISQNVNISIIESDASAMKCKYAFKYLGYEYLAKKYNINLVNLSEEISEKVNVKVGNENLHFMIPNVIKDAELKINIPKIKYLPLTKISCALKNIFGCNPESNKFKYHSNLDKTIVALNKIMKFDINIIDGIVVSGSRPKKLGLIMASEDPVAIDAAAARIAGINPKSIRFLQMASMEGLGNVKFITKGINPKYFEDNYPRLKMKQKLLNTGYNFLIWSGLLDTEMI